MWIREPWPGEILYIARNMREMDAREILDMRPERDPDLFAAILAGRVSSALICAVAGLDNAPVAAAVVGIWASPEYPWQADALMFATDAFPALARGLIRHVRDVFAPAVLAGGIHRIEARALASHTASRRFMRAAGAVEEATLPDHGRLREPYVLCAWRRSDWEKRRVFSKTA